MACNPATRQPTLCPHCPFLQHNQGSLTSRRLSVCSAESTRRSIGSPRLFCVGVHARQLDTSSLPADATKLARTKSTQSNACSLTVTATYILATQSMQSHAWARPRGRQLQCSQLRVCTAQHTWPTCRVTFSMQPARRLHCPAKPTCSPSIPISTARLFHAGNTACTPSLVVLRLVTARHGISSCHVRVRSRQLDAAL